MDQAQELTNGNAHPPSPLCGNSGEDDPELEREFDELAQLLLDAYLWKLEQGRKAGDGRIDSR